MDYHFTGIIAMRTFLLTLLFGIIPFGAYLVIWEMLSSQQEIHYNTMFANLLLPTAFITILFLALGFALSLRFTSIKTNDNICTIRRYSIAKLFFPSKITFRWDEVDRILMDEDLGKTTLSIFLRNGHKYELTHSLLLRGSTDFRAFANMLGVNTGL